MNQQRFQCSSTPAQPGLLQLASFAAPGLVHGFFNRHGGVSPPPFTTRNVSFGVGDSMAAVEENRTRLKQNLKLQTMVSARQVHDNKVFIVDKSPGSDFEALGYDGLITRHRIGLMIQQADCQAVIFHDPVKWAIGAAHAGWRGSVAGILGATIEAMTDNFGSDPADIKAAISPSLGPCCAEFVNHRQELPKWMHAFQVRPNYFDFWKISRIQLQEAGLQPLNIKTAAICTGCNRDYFSYRRAGITGRCATVIGLISR